MKKSKTLSKELLCDNGYYWVRYKKVSFIGQWNALWESFEARGVMIEYDKIDEIEEQVLRKNS